MTLPDVPKLGKPNFWLVPWEGAGKRRHGGRRSRAGAAHRNSLPRCGRELIPMVDYVPAPLAVLWSWAFCVKTSPELGLVLSSSLTAMKPPPAPPPVCTTDVPAGVGPDATALPPGWAVPNSASVATVAAPANISCIKRTCRRRASTVRISWRSAVEGFVLMPFIYRAAAWD